MTSCASDLATPNSVGYLISIEYAMAANRTGRFAHNYEGAWIIRCRVDVIDLEIVPVDLRLQALLLERE